MLQQLFAVNTFAFILIFVRVGAVITVLPGFSAGYVSIRIRLLLALAISFLLTPVLAERLPGLPATPMALGLLLLAETLIGLFLGSLARIVVASVHVAGTFASYFASLTSALVNDPVTDQQSSTIAGFFGTVGVLLIFVADLHHLILSAVAESYAIFVPGALPPIGDFADMIAQRVAASFALGLQMAAPFLIFGMAYYIGLGLLGRLMPQLQVFFIGIPLQISLQIWVMMLTLSGIMMVFLNRFSEVLSPFAGL
jgi:flagellar biosynthetic protein FliR